MKWNIPTSLNKRFLCRKILEFKLFCIHIFTDLADQQTFDKRSTAAVWIKVELISQCFVEATPHLLFTGSWSPAELWNKLVFEKGFEADQLKFELPWS